MFLPLKVFNTTLSPLRFVRAFLPGRQPADKYEKLSQGIAETPVEPFLKIDILLGDRQQPIERRPTCLERLRLPAFYLIIFLAATLLYVLATASETQQTKHISYQPTKIFFKDRSVNEVNCDTPLEIVTNDAEAQVVIWSSPALNISKYDGEKLRRENPGQLHGFWSLENAEYYPNVKKARQKMAMEDPGAFDFEATYKTTSDFPIPYAYGFIDPRRLALPFEARRQDKIAAAFVSNCSPLNNRTQVLQKLIDLLPGQVDSFGYCLNNAKADQVVEQLNLNPSIPGQPHRNLSRWEEKMSIIGQYKFTIAFENANEEDYVTEKYYQALSAGSIPIHLGLTAEQFEKFKPSPNSALNVADFNTVEELADRIKQIANDRVSFESALAWKNQSFPDRFDEILSWGKVHEACRIAKFLRKEWRNPHAPNQERYDSFYQRLNLTAS